MALDAGTVFATLGGRFDPTGFHAFGSAMVRARGEMDATERRSKTMGDRSSASLHRMGQAAKVVAAGGVLGLGAALVYSVKKAADFEAQLSSLQSVSNASGRSMTALKKQAMDAGAATKYSALQAAQAQTELAKGGLSVTKILGGGLQGALALAAAGEMDLADAAAVTANALNLFKLNGSEATHVADAFATAANNTTADVHFFAEGLAQGGLAAKTAGLTFDETTAALEAMAANGFKSGSDAGTSLKTMLTQLASPTEKAAGEAKRLGLSFFDAHGSLKPLPALASMLRDKLGGLTDQQRLQTASTLVGQDGMRGLISLYQAGGAEMTRYEKSLQRQGTAAEVAAQKQDNFQGKLENFKGSVETAAIAVGSRLLPMLTQLLVQGTDALNHFAASGQLEHWADGIVAGAKTAGHVLGDVARGAADVAHVLGTVGGALDLGDPTKLEAIAAAFVGFKVAGVVAPMVFSLAGALQTLVLNARTAPTVGAFLSSLVGTVNPVTAVAIAVGGLAAGLVILGSREGAEERAAKANAQAHRDQAEAIKSVNQAERASADKGLAAQQSTLDKKRAEQDLANVRAQIAKGEIKGAEAKRALARAELDVKQATLTSKSAHDAYANSLQHQNKVNDERIAKAKKYIAETSKEVKRTGDTAFVQSRTGNANDQAAANKKLSEAQARNTQAVQSYVQAVARANVSDASRQRLMNSASQITEKNAGSIAQLITAIDGLPTKKQTSILLTGSQAVLAQLGDLAGQLTAMGRKRTVTNILAHTSTASAAVLAFKAILAGVDPKKVARVVAETKGAAEVAALKRLIDQTNSKSVSLDVTTRYKQLGSPSPGAGVGTGTPGGARRRASGRGPGSSEHALVGEGAGPEWYVDLMRGRAHRVDAPTLMDIAPGAYVIPTEDRYRGRGIELLAMLAADLGVPGYKAGKKPSHFRPSTKKADKAVRDLPVPEKITYAAVPEDELSHDVDAARKAWKTRDGSIKTYEKKVRADRDALKRAQARKGKGSAAAKKAAQAKLDRDQGQLHALEHGGNGLRSAQAVYTDWREQSSLLKKLQAANREIERLNTIQETDRTKLATAAAAHDEPGYLAAQKDRKSVLATLKASFQKALGLAKDGSNFKAGIDSQLQTVIGELADSDQGFDDAKSAGKETEADRIAATGMTDAERKRLSEINRDIALAALTGKGSALGGATGLIDDTARAGELVDFLTGVLGRDLADGTAPDVITEIAGNLKTARDNLTALQTGGTSGSVDNPDLQAQLDQERTRRKTAEDSARINAAALEVFGGSGDIGEGGPNAMAAARGGPNIIFQSYVPPSPQEAMRLANYTVGGIDGQGSRLSPRETVG